MNPIIPKPPVLQISKPHLPLIYSIPSPRLLRNSIALPHPLCRSGGRLGVDAAVRLVVARGGGRALLEIISQLGDWESFK